MRGIPEILKLSPRPPASSACRSTSRLRSQPCSHSRSSEARFYRVDGPARLGNRRDCRGWRQHRDLSGRELRRKASGPGSPLRPWQGRGGPAFTQATFLRALRPGFSVDRAADFPRARIGRDRGLDHHGKPDCGVRSCRAPNLHDRKTGSTAIKADRAHYLTDIVFNAAVLIALGVSHWTGWSRADPAFAVGSGYMLWSAYGIVGEAREQLLDQSFHLTRGAESRMPCGPATEFAISTI